jgi:predicted amidohydrolase
MKVAAIQFCPTFKDVQGNLRRLAALTIKAAQDGAKICVLPELCLTGYSMMSKDEAEPLAEVITDFKPGKGGTSSMDVFYAIAKKYDVHVAWGLVEKSHTGNLHNSQVLMCPDGSFEFMAKVNFFGNDFMWATAGRSNPPIRKIEVAGKSYKVGLLICRDVRDKKDDNWKSFYEKGDADIVAISCAWGKSSFPATAWMNFVEENNTTLVVSNRYGIEANNDFGAGGIGIISPDGTVQCKGLVWGQDCIVYGEV